MSTLTALRQTLDQIITEASTDLDALAAARNAELDQRERELAMAAEELCPPVLEMGISIGMDRMREQVLLLIAEQQQQLKRGGTNATVLQALRRLVLEVQS
jgi:hypothetical protein